MGGTSTSPTTSLVNKPGGQWSALSAPHPKFVAEFRFWGENRLGVLVQYTVYNNLPTGGKQVAVSIPSKNKGGILMSCTEVVSIPIPDR